MRATVTIEQVVCDLVDDKEATQTISWRAGAGAPMKRSDLCQEHFDLLTAHAASGRGRPRGSTNKRTTTRAKRTGTRKRTARKS